jgi:hypothetical protein
MSSLDISKVNELVEHPEYFLVGTVDKRLAWSMYLPLRLAAKRMEYVHSLKIPHTGDHKLSGAASAAGTIAGLATALTFGIGFAYDKGTSGYVAFKNCSLKRGQIIDFSDKSVVAIVFPFNENDVKGKIKANIKGFYWKNKVLTGVELDLESESEHVKRSIGSDEELMSIIQEFFNTIIYWTAFAGEEIELEIKNIGMEKYSVIKFTLLRPLKKNIELLMERGKDIRKIPELIFDISKSISEKIVSSSLPPPPPPLPPPPDEGSAVSWL